MEYLDFELEIGPGLGREYPVRVIRSPAGEARETMIFPFDDLVLQNRLQALEIALLRSGGKSRRAPSPEEQNVQDFGKDLFKALVGGEVLSRYEVSRREAQQQRKGLRLKLRFQAPELAALPWEFLYDHRRGEYLCLSTNTPTIRYLELPQPIPSLTVTPPLRILGMIASPLDLLRLDVERERQRIENAVQDLQKQGFLELTWLPGQTWYNLQEAMWGGPWHVFHFIGHGGFDPHTDEGLIALADEKGQKHLLAATQVARLLADHQDLRLVLLNSCEGAKGGKLDIYSSTAAILVRRGIAAVLAMQYEITDRAAIEFSRTFYRALVYGLPIDAAVAAARAAVNIEVKNSLEWGTPVLYMRSPDGVLFDLAALPLARPEPVIDETGAAPSTPVIEAKATPAREESEPAAALGQETLKPGSQGEAARPESAPETVIPTIPGKSLLPRIGAAVLLAVVLFLAGWWLLLPPKMTSFTNSLGMTFVPIPAGTFQMGSPAGEAGREKDERQHQVTISRPFYLQTTEVTQGQWQRVMGSNPAYFNKCGKDCPVEQVSWDDAQEFIKKLNQMEKTDKYRLPTEAEWEWACRAKSTGRFSFGDDEAGLKDYAWYTRNSASKTHPVGQLKPNAWGLSDMHGNVWEWCRDWYGEYPAGHVTDPQGPNNGTYRVLRGGSWANNSGSLRSAVRGNLPYGRPNDIGFRVARTF